MTKEQEIIFDFDKVVFGGYDAEQVEEFAVQMHQAVASLQKENAALTQKLRILAGKMEEYQAQAAATEAPAVQTPQAQAAPETSQAPRPEEAFLKEKEALVREIHALWQENALLKKENEAARTAVAVVPAEQITAALAEQTRHAEQAEQALAKSREEGRLFCCELIEKIRARQEALAGTPTLSPVMAAVPPSPAASPIPATQPALEKSIAETDAPPALECASPATPDPAVAAGARPRPLAAAEQQTYEECMARILQQEANGSQLQPGESKIVSLRPPEGAVFRAEPPHRPEQPVSKPESARAEPRMAEMRVAPRPAPPADPRRSPAPPLKKKKAGLFEFVRESVRKALDDDEDEDDDGPDTLQFGKAYDVNKRK